MPQFRQCALHAAVVAVCVALIVPGAPVATASQNDVPAHDPDRVLVAFRPATPALERAAVHAREDGRVENRMEWHNLDVVGLRRGDDPVAASRRYERHPHVAFAHPNWEVRLLGVPNDTLFKDLWGLHNTGQQVTGSFVEGLADADIDAPQAWDTAYGTGAYPSSGGARVGILDTGIDRAHADLLDKTKACATAVSRNGTLTQGLCSDDNAHGTHVAGTVAAIANNGLGVAGVAPNAELAVFKALNAAGVGFYADVIAGIHWLHTAGQASVVNMSIGGPQDDALDKELAEAYQADTLLVAAAGNDGDSTATYPASHADVVSVAATDAADEHAWFSNCNSDVELAAPGVAVWSTTPANTYLSLDGTSMATPHVSGAAAVLMWNQGLGHAKTRDALANSADDLGPNGRDSCFGYGRINLERALGDTATSPPPSADPGAIAGQVSDVRTKAGIEAATVDCGTGGSATTDADGSYSISPVEPGAYSCTASASGYRPKSRNITVESGQTTTADFALRTSRR